MISIGGQERFAAARSEDIGGGAYSGGLDRDDGRGDGEVNTGAASGKSILKLEEEVERLQELVWEWEDSVQRADHPVKLEDRIRRRYDAIQKLERKKEELKAARARLEQSVQGRGPQYKGKEVVAPPGPSRLNPYPDEEEEDVLQALTSLSARAPDRPSSSDVVAPSDGRTSDPRKTTSAGYGGPKGGGTRAGVSPLDMKVADTLARMAVGPSPARRSAMSDAVSDAGSGAGGSGARLEGSGKRQSTGGGEEGTGDSTAESGPRTEQSWTEYLTELRGAMNKAVDMTEQAKGNRTYMTEAKRAVSALRTKARSAPPLHPNLEGFRSEPVSDSVEKSSVLADACDYVLNLLGSALLNVVEIAKASQAMRILCREADQTVTRELHLVNEPVTLMPTPPRPDLVQQSEGANPGETVGDQLRKDKWPAQTSAQNPAPEISSGVFRVTRQSPRTRSQAPADGSGRPSSPDTSHARPRDSTWMMFVGKGKASRAKKAGVPVNRNLELGSIDDRRYGRETVSQAADGDVFDEYGSNMLKIHPLPEDIPATKEPTNKTYESKVMQGVDAPFPFTVPDSDHRILYKRHTIGDGDSLYYAISLIRAFRRGENINEKDLEVKMEWLKTSLLENLSNYVNRAKDKQLISEYKTESDIREILNSEWANTDVAAIAAQFLRNDITIISRDEGDPGTKETKRKYDDMATGIPSAPATVADAVRLSWLSRFPGQTGAPTQEEAKKGK
eukprot:jgi/Mesvir1/25137/Mv04347-RA.1